MDYLVGKNDETEIYGAHGHDIEKSDLSLSIELSRLLSNHYPGYQWMVGVLSEGGVIDIKCLDVSTEYGYRLIRPWDDPHDIMRHKVMMAGGEILERANINIGRKKDGELPEFVEGIEKAQYQPAVLRNIQKYGDLLNAPPKR